VRELYKYPGNKRIREVAQLVNIGNQHGVRVCLVAYPPASQRACSISLRTFTLDRNILISSLTSLVAGISSCGIAARITATSKRV